MEEVVFLVGAVTLSIFAAACFLLLAFAVVDAVVCARFIWRVRLATKKSGDKFGFWTLPMQWLRYWIGVTSRPDYLVLNSNDETIYWPGKEGSRRYLA